MINRHIIIGLLCMVYAVVHAQDVDYQHPPINCDVSIFIDYLPAKLMNYHEPEICLYSKPPLCFYLDTMAEHWDNILNGTAVNYCKQKNRTYALAFSRYAADGYLEVNHKVFQYLISNDIDDVPHSFVYYIDGRLIDKHNIKLLLRLRKDRIKSVDVEFDTKTNTIIVEIEKNGISFAHRVFEDYCINNLNGAGIKFRTKKTPSSVRKKIINFINLSHADNTYCNDTIFVLDEWNDGLDCYSMIIYRDKIIELNIEYRHYHCRNSIEYYNIICLECTTDIFKPDFYAALHSWDIKSWNNDYLRKSGYGIYSCGGTLIQRFIYHDEKLIDVDAKWLPLYRSNYTNKNAKPQKGR